MTQVLKKSNNLQLLISTKGKKDFSFLYKMFDNCLSLDYSILIVDQSEIPKDLSLISELKNIDSSRRRLPKTLWGAICPRQAPPKFL